MNALILVGALLVVASALLWIGAGDGMAERMPTQVPPRRFSAGALVVGAVLLVVGVVGRVIP